MPLISVAGRGESDGPATTGPTAAARTRTWLPEHMDSARKGPVMVAHPDPDEVDRLQRLPLRPWGPERRNTSASRHTWCPAVRSADRAHEVTVGDVMTRRVVSVTDHVRCCPHADCCTCMASGRTACRSAHQACRDCPGRVISAKLFQLTDVVVHVADLRLGGVSIAREPDRLPLAIQPAGPADSGHIARARKARRRGPEWRKEVAAPSRSWPTVPHARGPSASCIKRGAHYRRPQIPGSDVRQELT